MKQSLITITESVDLNVVDPIHRQRFFNPGELDTLATLLAMHNVKRMVEFGCQNGRTAKVLLNHFPEMKKYIGIDVPPAFETTCKVQRKEVPAVAGELAFGDPRFVCLTAGKGSHYVNSDMLGVVDAAFIDGDHSYQGVMNDYQLCLESMTKGGIIIFHDYHDLGTVGVKEALDELVYQGSELVHCKGTWICYQIVKEDDHSGE